MQPIYIGLEMSLEKRERATAAAADIKSDEDPWLRTSFTADSRSSDFTNILSRISRLRPPSHNNIDIASLTLNDTSFEYFGSFCIVIHDGNFVLQVIIEQILLESSDKSLEQVFIDYMVEWLDDFMDSQRVKIIAAGICEEGLLPTVTSRFWQDLDILPCIFSVDGPMADMRAESAVRKALTLFGPSSIPIPRICVGYQNIVEVDAECIRIAELNDYKNVSTHEMWTKVTTLAESLKNVKVSFISATPQGGGVALMRHSLLRFSRLLGLDFSWYVVRPSYHAFQITKRKFHNVLQGISNEFLSPEDIVEYERWITDNGRAYWSRSVFRDSDVVVLDDPQVLGLVPMIMENRANGAKPAIIYRSHIHIQSDLITYPPVEAADTLETSQSRVWKYLMHFLQHVDYFISHPVPSFVPANSIDPEKIIYLSASTDPIDGLNKPIVRDRDKQYYWGLFDRICNEQGIGGIRDSTRPYIIQIARFDPSKGIPDVLEAFRLLRKKTSLPQLIICGHGSIDDPDGSVVFEQTIRHIKDRKEFQLLIPDILVARIPPSDQMLNVLLADATVCLQLSYREGFEVKVTESIWKNVPVIAYDAGGIPLQISNEDQGFIVSVGDVRKVAEILWQTYFNGSLHETAANLARKEFSTVTQMINWLDIIAKTSKVKQ